MTIFSENYYEFLPDTDGEIVFGKDPYGPSTTPLSGLPLRSVTEMERLSPFGESFSPHPMSIKSEMKR